MGFEYFILNKRSTIGLTSVYLPRGIDILLSTDYNPICRIRTPKSITDIIFVNIMSYHVIRMFSALLDSGSGM